MAILRSPFVLASGSPRRREILTQLGLAFRVVTSDVDETRHPDEEALAYVRRMADEKAQAVLDALVGETPAPLVLAADTIVVLDGDVLGKPENDAHAKVILERLSGREHRVVTALSAGVVDGSVRVRREVVTKVTFRPLKGSEIDRYVATGEGRDKAGSYAIQGIGAGLVQGIEGSYTNVVGLPAAETLLLLREAGLLEAWP